MNRQRPRRQRKGDRLVTPDATAAQIRCDYALAPFDRLARDMEHKWGIERLPELVPVEMAERYGSAIAKLNAALDADDPAEVAIRAAVCIRGLQAMDAAAEAAEMPKADPTVWEYEYEGIRFGIMADDKSWQAVKAARPELVLFTMREVAIALKAWKFEQVAEIKKAFPQARIEKITTKAPPDYDNGGDPIPF